MRSRRPGRLPSCTVPVGATLFHGTGDAFDGHLAPGGDGLVWFADDPRIAQLYIPRAGTTVHFSPYRLTWPTRDPHLVAVQRAIGVGFDLDDVTWDELGKPTSWPKPRGWSRPVTEEWVESQLVRMGFDRSGFSFSAGFSGGELIRPGGSIQGRLYVVSVLEPLEVWRKAKGESDLTDLQYNDLVGFRAARRGGLDGALIDDFAQAAGHGNVGHLSVGLFERAARKLEATWVPATNRGWGERARGTPEWPDPPKPILGTLL